MTLRRFIFWLHLSVGLIIGLVVVFLAVTGSILAFQSQITAWAERNARVAIPAPVNACISPATLLARTMTDQQRPPTSLTLFSDPHRPAEIVFGRDILLVNACSGDIIRRDAGRLRNFFLDVKDLHRWVAWGGVRHESLRAIKDAANLCFFFLLLSGLYLWFPRKISWQHFKPAMLFRSNLKGRARDWNLHNIFGFWMALPLLCMVLTGTIMAYPWATALLYHAAGSPPPTVKPEAEPRQRKALSAGEYSSLDPAIRRAMAQDPHWNSLLMRMPAEKDTAIAFTVDEGEGGIPHQRAQLSIARKDARIIRWEPFSANPRGRQWRLDARSLHTGEIFGPIGQLIALLAALSLLLLVWTGFSLAIRRWLAWKTRKISLAKQAPQHQETYS
jgi:uncharacterized iron-regulated membrane protein